MEWFWKLIWKMKSDEQILIAKDDAMFWMSTYQGGAKSTQKSAQYRWETFIFPELKRRKLDVSKSNK